MKPLALVCDDSINGLGIIRSLSEASQIRIVAMARSGSVAAASRHVDQVLPYADGDDLSELISDFLESVNPLRVVPYPASDRMLVVLSRLSKLHDNLVFLDDPDQVERFFSKVTQYEMADSIGVATPAWFHHQIGDAIREMGDAAQAVRPANRLEQPGIRSPIKMAMCKTGHELSESVRSLEAAGFSAIVSDFIPGPEANLFTYGGYARQGKVLADFVGRKLWHTYPTRVAAIAVSAHDEEVETEGRRFVEAVGLSGLFQVELKRSASDGRLYLIEMNQRNWLWGQLSTACGSNLPVAKYASEANESSLICGSSRSEGVYINEYGVLSNVWGYRSIRPAWFAARALVSRNQQTTLSIARFKDPGPVLSALRSLLPGG